MQPEAPRIAIVAAMAENRVIGCRNRLPWHLPADLAHFRQLTLDKPIVMGRRTWESLPGFLPRRMHIVVTRNRTYRAPGALVAGTPEEALAAAMGAPEILVVGGEALYRAMLPVTRRMYLTLVAAVVEGDAFFPDWDPACWRETAREERPRDERNAYDLTFLTLERMCAQSRGGGGQSLALGEDNPKPDGIFIPAATFREAENPLEISGVPPHSKCSGRAECPVRHGGFIRD